MLKDCETDKQKEDAPVELMEKGLSLTRAAGGVLGLHHRTVHRWKADDEEFAERLHQAESKFVALMPSHIAAQAEIDWRAAADILGRRFPSEFAKPETRLNVDVDATPMPKLESLEKLMEASPQMRAAVESFALR